MKNYEKEIEELKEEKQWLDFHFGKVEMRNLPTEIKAEIEELYTQQKNSETGIKCLYELD